MEKKSIEKHDKIAPGTWRGEEMKLIVEIEREDDGRWLAEIGELPGVLAYGVSEAEATAKAQALALRVIADRLEHGEQDPNLQSITFAAA
jgi:predicted RNase H-like HicB family nuclease